MIFNDSINSIIGFQIVQLAAELEEVKSQLEVFERNKRIQDGEIQKMTDLANELQTNNSQLAGTKKKLELDIQSIHVG